MFKIIRYGREGYISLPKTKRGFPKGKGKKINLENRELVEILLHDGYPQADVAKVIGVERQSICLYLQRNPWLDKVWEKNRKRFSYKGKFMYG